MIFQRLVVSSNTVVSQVAAMFKVKALRSTRWTCLLPVMVREIEVVMWLVRLVMGRHLFMVGWVPNIARNGSWKLETSQRHPFRACLHFLTITLFLRLHFLNLRFLTLDLPNLHRSVHSTALTNHLANHRNALADCARARQNTPI